MAKETRENTAAGIDPELLRKVFLFRSVSLESIQGIFDFCKIHLLKKDEILFSPGQTNWTIYFVIQGQLRIHLSELNSDPVALLGPGESVGELSVIDKQPTTAYAVADHDCLLISMDEDILWSLVHSSHAIACNLLYTLAKRLRNANSVVSGGGVLLDQEDHHYGNVDALTGLPNREWFIELLKRQLLRSVHSGQSLSLVLTDIDGFKAFNDLYGRRCGDRVLYAMAGSLNNHLRPTEIIARYGADQFSILLPDTEIETARAIAVRLFKSIEKATPIIIAEGKVVNHPSISVGVTVLKAGQDMDSFCSEAEAALSRAKQLGGNAVSE